LIFVLIVVAFGLGSYGILSNTLTPAFDELEYQASEADMARARQGLSTFVDALGDFATDWAHWDDAFEFMLGNYPKFVDVNLGPETLNNVDLNIVLLYDMTGTLRWGKYVNDETDEVTDFTDSIVSTELIRRLQQHQTTLSELDGFVASSYGPAIVSSRPIAHSDRSGPIVGTLILGQLINSDRVQQLGRMTEVDLALQPTKSVQRSISLARERNTSDNDVLQEVQEDARISSQILRDIHGGRVATLVVRSPRGISGLGREAVQGVMISIATLGSAIIIGIWWLLRRLVVSPIGRLQLAMTEIQHSDDLSQRIEMLRSDEVGQLAAAFNTMIGKLEESKRRNIEQSFKAGMAEVAAGVLHNIRNMLMPIVNGVATAHESIARPIGQNTSRAIAELCSESTVPERKVKLLHYLDAAHDEVIEERGQILENLDTVSRQLDQVTRVLQDQELYMHEVPVLESVNLAEAIDEAREILPATNEPAVDLVIDSELGEQTVKAHRVGLLQVLSNILLNAYESIRRTGQRSGQIEVRAGVDKSGGDHRVRLTIRDTGAGITSDSLLRIFDRGYTSKVDGDGGLGLHWSANTLAGMQGRIEAASDGTDRGAEFHITLEAA